MKQLLYQGQPVAGQTLPAELITLLVSGPEPLASYRLDVLQNGIPTGYTVEGNLIANEDNSVFADEVELDLRGLTGAITLRETLTTQTDIAVTVQPETTLLIKDNMLPNGLAFVALRQETASADISRTLSVAGTNITHTANFRSYPNGRTYAFFELDLSGLAAGEYTLEESTDEVVQATTLVQVVEMTPWDQLAYRSGPRLPWQELQVVTGAEAAELSDFSGLYIKGAFTAKANAYGKDFILEANARAEFLLRGSQNLIQHCTVSGLERDEQGYPKYLHQVRQAIGFQLKAQYAELCWANDTYRIGSNAYLRDSYCHSHTFVTWGTNAPEQHRDGVQITQGGGVQVEDNYFDNWAAPQPLLADGVIKVPGTYSKAASAGFMMNSDKPWTNWIDYHRNYARGGSSVTHANVATSRGATDYQWVRMTGNVTLERARNSKGQGMDFNLPRGFVLDPSNIVLQPDGTTKAPTVVRY